MGEVKKSASPLHGETRKNLINQNKTLKKRGDWWHFSWRYTYILIFKCIEFIPFFFWKIYTIFILKFIWTRCNYIYIYDNIKWEKLFKTFYSFFLSKDKHIKEDADKVNTVLFSSFLTTICLGIYIYIYVYETFSN